MRNEGSAKQDGQCQKAGPGRSCGSHLSCDPESQLEPPWSGQADRPVRPGLPAVQQIARSTRAPLMNSIHQHAAHFVHPSVYCNRVKRGCDNLPQRWGARRAMAGVCAPSAPCRLRPNKGRFERGSAAYWLKTFKQAQAVFYKVVEAPRRLSSVSDAIREVAWLGKGSSVYTLEHVFFLQRRSTF